MKFGVPWKVKVGRTARESAQQAARRAGMSIEDWLDGVILASASNAGSDQPRPKQGGAEVVGGHQPPARDDLYRLVGRDPPSRAAGGHGLANSPALADSAEALDHALREIAERQRALEDAAPAPGTLPRAPSQELSALASELRQINSRIDTLSRPCGIDAALSKAVGTLRDDLAEIGLLLQDAMPRKAVEALESEVRKLADRLDHTRHDGADAAAIAGIEGALAEVRDSLRALTTAENVVGFARTVQELSHKVDLIAGNTPDPATLKQLEGSILAMRGDVSHVSNEALARLCDEVRSLADKVEQAGAGSGSDARSSLERRIETLAEALEARNRDGQDVPGELQAAVSGLIGKIESIQLDRGDHTALGHLEDRIVRLVEKLDASDARLNRLEPIERGLAELLVHLEQQRPPQPAPTGSAPPPEVDALQRDVAELRHAEKETQDTLEAVHGTLTHVVDRLATIETDLRDRRAPAPAAPAPHTGTEAACAVVRPRASTIPPLEAPAATVDASIAEAGRLRAAAAPGPPRAAAGERRPIDPSLPPDHPLEPGLGAARGRYLGSPADRIAASEAALGPAKPPVIPDPGGKSSFIAAARRAAQAAVDDATTRDRASPADQITRRIPAPSQAGSSACCASTRAR